MSDDWTYDLPPIPFEELHNFGPAAKGRNDVFGCAKPDTFTFGNWIEAVRENDISKIVVLCEQNDYSSFIDKFDDEFGQMNVLRATVKDYHLCEKEMLNGKIIPFIEESIKRGEKVVVHCNAGSGRTGHVLAAWLYYHVKTMDVNEALQEVRGKGIAFCERDPHEAVKKNNATLEDLQELIRSTRE